MSRDTLRFWLVFASPFVMAAITVSIGMLEDRGLIAVEARYGGFIGWGNAALAALGSAAGAILGPGGAPRRAVLAVACGALAVPTYLGTFFAGAVTFLRLGP